MISLFIIYVIGCILSYGLSYNFWYEFEKSHLQILVDVEGYKGYVIFSSLFSWASVFGYLMMSISSGYRIRLKYRIK